VLVVYLARDHPAFLQEHKEEGKGIRDACMIHIKHVLTCLHELNHSLCEGGLQRRLKIMDGTLSVLCLHAAYTIISAKVSWL